jgi:hypothetical protein
MKLSIDERIIQLCKERAKLHKEDKNVPIYPYVSDQIFNEYGVRYDSEKLRSISRKYRDSNKLNEYFELKQFNDKDAEEYKATIELNKDGTQTSDILLKMSAEQAKDPEFLLKAHGYDPNMWELISARNNIWNVFCKDSDNNIQKDTLYSSKIVVKPATETHWSAERIDNILKSIKREYKSKITHENHEDNNQLLVVPIADLHYNLLSDVLSTGNKYDTVLAEEYYYYVLNDIKARTRHRKFQKVLFVVGNDFCNADNMSGTTTKGTPQDNHLVWYEAVDNIPQLIINGIDILRTIAPVDVLYVPSNHDLHTMYGAMGTVDVAYRNEPSVNIIRSPMFRKYYNFDKTLLIFSHDMKVKDSLEIITTEARDYWSNSKHVIAMLAHLHEAMIYEKQGMLEIYRLPTISGWSRWTNTQGYVQSDKKNKCFIIDGEKGIIDEINTVF